MFKQTIAAGAAALFTITAANAAPLSEWAGNWVKNTDGLHSLSITNADGALSVSVKGECSPNPCDWGSAPATAYSNSAATTPAANTETIIAVFAQGFATKTVVLDGRAGNTLRAHVYTHFVDGSGRSDYVQHTSMKRPVLIARPIPGIIAAQPIKPFEEDCISFNPAQVSVAQKNGSWKLVQGSMWMLDAGTHKAEMSRAKTIVQHYAMNKQCFIGRPDASLKYWLANNKAPTGPLSGEDCTNINPNGLSVRNAGGDRFTVLSNGNHAAFSAPSAAEAQKIVDVIKHYGFTKSCFVGRPDPSMAYLRK